MPCKPSQAEPGAARDWRGMTGFPEVEPPSPRRQVSRLFGQNPTGSGMVSVIENAFAALDRFDGQLTLPAIMDWFREEPLTVQDLTSYLTFNPARYVRNLVHNGPAYQALVLCCATASGARSTTTAARAAV